MDYLCLTVNKVKIYEFETVVVSKEITGIPYNVILISSALDKSELGDPVIHMVIDDSPVPIKIAKSHHKMYYYVIPEAPMVLQWVRKNYELLMDHWNGTITDSQIIDVIYIGENDNER